jgi:hypothetical protein
MFIAVLRAAAVAGHLAWSSDESLKNPVGLHCSEPKLWSEDPVTSTIILFRISFMLLHASYVPPRIKLLKLVVAFLWHWTVPGSPVQVPMIPLSACL